MKPSSQPNAAERRWLEAVVDYGPAALDLSCQKMEVHHVAGRSAKHNKVDIGHWWILYLPKTLHDLAGTPAFDQQIFGFTFGGRWDAEKLLFRRVASDLRELIPDEVYQAIMDYRR